MELMGLKMKAKKIVTVLIARATMQLPLGLLLNLVSSRPKPIKKSLGSILNQVHTVILNQIHIETPQPHHQKQPQHQYPLNTANRRNMCQLSAQLQLTSNHTRKNMVITML